MINFSNVEQAVQALKSQYAAGSLNNEEFQAKLMELIDSDPDGSYWMIGQNSNEWYRFDGNSWVTDTPNLASAETALSLDQANWDNIDLNWLLTSLIILLAIGSIVYISA